MTILGGCPIVHTVRCVEVDIGTSGVNNIDCFLVHANKEGDGIDILVRWVDVMKTDVSLNLGINEASGARTIGIGLIIHRA